jgi:hypothetical protein
MSGETWIRVYKLEELMKVGAAFIILVVFSAVAFGDQHPTSQKTATSLVQPHSTSGRYQILNVTWGEPGTIEVNCLIRIDNETGKTWILWPLVPNMDPKRQGWMPIGEYPPPIETPPTATTPPT